MASQARPIKILALTRQGRGPGPAARPGLPGAQCWLPEAQAGEPGDLAFSRLSEAFREAFAQGENLVCIMAAGIVVRGIAPYLKGKDTDPAVVVVDEAGRFAISLFPGTWAGPTTWPGEWRRYWGAPRSSPRPPTCRGCRPWTCWRWRRA